MGINCNDNRPVMLSSSKIGNISQCVSCDSYHFVIGNISLRMERKHLISLSQMIIDPLEANADTEEAAGDYYIRTQA